MEVCISMVPLPAQSIKIVLVLIVAHTATKRLAIASEPGFSPPGRHEAQRQIGLSSGEVSGPTLGLEVVPLASRRNVRWLKITNPSDRAITLATTHANSPVFLEYLSVTGTWTRAQVVRYDQMGVREVPAQSFILFRTYAPSKGVTARIRFTAIAEGVAIHSLPTDGFVDPGEVEAAQLDEHAMRDGTVEVVRDVATRIAAGSPVFDERVRLQAVIRLIELSSTDRQAWFALQRVASLANADGKETDSNAVQVARKFLGLSRSRAHHP